MQICLKLQKLGGKEMTTLIRKIRISESMSGHDGAANGGNYGGYTILFGVYPEGAVSVSCEESLGAIHTSQSGNRLNYHSDIWHRDFIINVDILRQGDFVAIEKRYDGQVYNSSGGEIEILAHLLPVADKMPEGWLPVGGSRYSYRNDYGSKTEFSLLRIKGGATVSWEMAVKEMSLSEIIHPYGKIWMSGSVPVAINSMPIWSSGRDNSFDQSTIMGNREFFHSQGFSILEFEDRDTYYGAGKFFSCTHEIILRGQDKGRLASVGYYPVEVTKNMVVWGTGLHLYPKHLKWQVGMHPTCGTPEEDYMGAVGKGTRVFDSSPERLQRLEEFFFESIGRAGVRDPKAEYIRFANYQDPRGGKWGNSHHYPKESWKPHFEGWGLDRFVTVECRWKQPKEGAARFYGIIR
jgi:hypothetical protein